MSKDEIEKIVEKVENQVKEELEGKIAPDMFGYINIFESRKKEILKNEYGIEFKTMQENNITSCID